MDDTNDRHEGADKRRTREQLDGRPQDQDAGAQAGNEHQPHEPALPGRHPPGGNVPQQDQHGHHGNPDNRPVHQVNIGRGSLMCEPAIKTPLGKFSGN